MSTPERRRILVIDDNAAIHADFIKILGAKEAPKSNLSDAKAAFFGKAPAQKTADEYEIDTASQGREALDRVRVSVADNAPYALAFVDVRMPPGWDGVETIAHLWEADPNLQCVICTAFADYSWEEMIAKLGRTDRLLILKKPFDPIEVCQIASAMIEKWCGARREHARMEEVVKAEQAARSYAEAVETTNRALVLARDSAEAALDTKAKRIQMLGRELRAPLLAILEYADLLRGVELPDGRRIGHASEIQRQGEALLHVVSDLVDLSALEAGRLTAARAPVEPFEVAERVARAFAGRAREKGLELTVVCSSPIPAVIESDGERIQQLLAHLVDNAIKFTSAGSVRIELELDPMRLEDPMLTVRVVDTGAGMTAEQQGQLFEAFTPPDASTLRERGGAGIGLVLARGLAGLLGGDLTLESMPGKGTTATVTLRTGDLSAAELVQHPRAPMPSVVEAPKTVEGSTGALTGTRILLVEDVMSTQKLFAAFLESAGAEVVLAENGREALDLVQESEQATRPFDLVLMDIQMPVMDGHAATRELRARGWKRPIVAITAHAMTGDRERCLAAGCDDYASKPLGRKAFVELCAQHARPNRTAPADTRS
ncbi:MAG: response regulator [Planctomycetes bacterium]|nr:response regulator [Planctomycetota bacterium]